MRIFRATTALLLLLLAGLHETAAQNSSAAIFARIDALARDRYERILAFTYIEKYAVYRGSDETHAVATMTVKTTYRKGEGKSYAILSESGSGIFLKFGLHPLLDNEKEINIPGNVEKSWFTSANYDMRLQAGVRLPVNGRECLAIAMTPRHKAPNMIDGTLWVDVQDNSIVKIDGVASRNPSVFSGVTHMMRDYSNIDGFAMSHHARAESNSPLFGHTVVTIDYGDYQVQSNPAK